MQHRFISITMEQIAYFTSMMNRLFNYFIIVSPSYLNGLGIMAKRHTGTLFIVAKYTSLDKSIGKGCKYDRLRIICCISYLMSHMQRVATYDMITYHM